MPEREILCQSNSTASPNDFNEANKSTCLSAQLHWWGGVHNFYCFFPSLCVKIFHRATKALSWRLSRASCQHRSTALSAEQENGDLKETLLDQSSILQLDRELCPPGAKGPAVTSQATGMSRRRGQ